MKEFEAFLAKAIKQKSDFGSVNFLPMVLNLMNINFLIFKRKAIPSTYLYVQE